MKDFELVRPTSLEQAGAALSGSETGWEKADALLIAGGQDLVTELKEHLVEPERLVSLKSIPGLDLIEVAADGAARVGALATLAEIERHAEIARLHPMLVEAARSVASPAIRTLATLGGNLCQRPRCWYYRSEHAVCLKKGGGECFSYGGLNKFNAILGGGPSWIVHPSDLAPALVALDASIELAGPDGERSLALEAFFTLPAESDVTRENILAPDEIVTAVLIPARHEEWRSTYLKFREKSGFDFALSAVALAVRLEGEKIAEARLCLGGVAPVPWRSERAEELLVGRKLDAEAAELAGKAALWGAEPLRQNGYKIALTQGLIHRAVSALSTGAGG